MTDLYMAFRMDDQWPVGLLDINDDDTLMRGLGQWTPLSEDNRLFDDVEVVNVSEDFVSFFDMLDERDKLPTYKQTSKFVI